MDFSDWRSWVHQYGPSSILGVVAVFMIWIRVGASERVLTNEITYFGGNDAWYHARVIQLLVDHFPATLAFDPWSHFPYGTGRHSGFGGLFDQSIALAALLIGGGSPDPQLVEAVIAYAPPFFGALTAVPVYLVVRSFSNRWTGALSVVLLALLGGQFLNRTVIGAADHQSAEPFFGTIAMLGFVIALQIGYLEKPLLADVRDRNWIALRNPVSYAVLGGTAIASYLITWPPGVFLVFSMGVFIALQSIRDHFEGRPTDYVTFSTVASFFPACVLVLSNTYSLELSATAFSLLQPLVLFGILIGSIGLYALSRYIEQEDYRPAVYPVSIGIILLSIVLASWLAFPQAIGLLESLFNRVYSFGLLTGSTGLTVGEIHPATFEDAWRAFGPLFYVALGGLGLLIARVIRENRPIELLLVIWSISIFSAYFTMIRFGYYLAVIVAILSAFAIWWVAKTVLSLNAVIENPTEIEGYQVLGVLIILLAILPGAVVGVENRTPVWEQSEYLGGSDSDWHDELIWMNKNTPAPPLEYNELYERPEGDDYDYPPGAYGVMSWWDYGHWITYTARRIPAANPFQEGPREASAFFQAQSEERAELLLEALPSKTRVGPLYEHSDDELRKIIANQPEEDVQEDIRYVIIDDQMVAGKFSPIATWTGPGYGAYISNQKFQIRDQNVQVAGLNERYRRTMLARLYFGDARSLEHYRLVHESDRQMTFASVAQRSERGYQATQFLNRRVSPQLFQAVQRNPNLEFYDTRQAARVKIFERVAGAAFRGKVTDENTSTIYALLELRTNTGRNFTYVQSTQVADDGSYNMTVPYPTDDQVEPEGGGTNSGVHANGSYQIVEGNPFDATAIAEPEVPESAIYEGRVISIELEPIES